MEAWPDLWESLLAAVDSAEVETITWDNIHPHSVSNTFQQQQGMEGKEPDG